MCPLNLHVGVTDSSGLRTINAGKPPQKPSLSEVRTAGHAVNTDCERRTEKEKHETALPSCRV